MPLPTNSAAENALGTIGTICWTVQIIPQVWKSWRTKSTDGLSPWLMFIWGTAGAFLGVYVIVQNLNIPLIVQPQVFCALALLSWTQCLYYGGRRSLKTCVLIFLSVVLVCGGFEVGMVYAVQPSYNAGNERPTQFFGIFSAVISTLALLPQYYEIYVHKEVLGISLVFMAIDCLGGVFSFLSLIFKEELDVIASVTYLDIVIQDSIIMILALILNPHAKYRRAREAAGDVEMSQDSSDSVTVAGHDDTTARVSEKPSDNSMREVYTSATEASSPRN